MYKDSIFLQYQKGRGFPYLRDINELKTSTQFKEKIKDIFEKYINEGIAKIKFGRPLQVMLPIVIVCFIATFPLNMFFFPWGMFLMIPMFGSLIGMFVWIYCLSKKGNEYAQKAIEEVKRETHGCIRIHDSLSNLMSSQTSSGYGVKPGFKLQVIDRIQEKYAQKYEDLELLAFYNDQSNTVNNLIGNRPTDLQQAPINPYMQTPSQLHPQANTFGQKMHPLHQPMAQGGVQYQNPVYGQMNYQMVNNPNPGQPLNMNQQMPYQNSESLQTYEINLKNQGGQNGYHNPLEKIKE